MPVYGGVETGGTKVVCAVGSGPDNVRAEAVIPTTTPDETLARVVAFFEEQRRTVPIAAVGIGSFGPVSPDPAAADYGFITTTPKPGWAHTDVAGTLHRALGLPVAFDTDVNVAALSEARWGAGRGVATLAYVTVGTGIGGGGLINGQLMHGLMHPEMGHMFVPHDHEADPFPGVCPFHGDCLEGVASGPALAARWGIPGEKLPPDHPAWALEARYLALACVNIVSVLAPRRIILGGGVMRRRALFPLIHAQVQELLAGYIHALAVTRRIAEYIVPAALGERAGVLGAIALAERA